MLRSPKRFASWLPALFDGQFHWDFLRPVFKGTKIMPMDFDAVIERNGKVLIFETKNKGAEISVGQRMTLTDQWRKGSTIFHVIGKTPETIEGLAVYPGTHFNVAQEFGDRPLEDADAFDVIYRARCWFCWASNEAPPAREDWDNELWLWDYERGSK